MSSKGNFSRKSREAVILGERLSALREKANLKQEEVAIAVGMARSTLAGHEKGHSMPSREVLSKLARLFNVSLDYLDRGADVERPDQEGNIAAKVEVAKVLHLWPTLSDRDRDIILTMMDRMAKKS